MERLNLVELKKISEVEKCNSCGGGVWVYHCPTYGTLKKECEYCGTCTISENKARRILRNAK